jgi:hypothetical protein
MAILGNHPYHGARLPLYRGLRPDREHIHLSCTAESVLITLSITALGTNKISPFQWNVGF